MRHRKKVILLCAGIISFVLFYSFLGLYPGTQNNKLKLEFSVNSRISGSYQVFYKTGDHSWLEQNSVTHQYNTPQQWERLIYNLPTGIKEVRIDTGDSKERVSLRDFKLINNSAVDIPVDGIDIKTHNLELVDKSAGYVEFQVDNADPYFTLDLSSFVKMSENRSSLTDKLTNSTLSLIISFIIIFIISSAREVLSYVIEAYRGRNIIYNLARNDFKTKYASSYLGITWGFIQPLLTIATYWFVFQVGLRSGNVAEVPFILWFLVAIIPWFFFSDGLSSATNVFFEYSYLVKKVVFKVELLPLVKLGAALFVHLFFIIVIFIVYGIYGYAPTWYNLQLIYYMICSFALVFSISLITSTLVLFFRDLNQIILIVLQMGFWFTPIGWSYTMVNDFWLNIFKLNPMFYVVNGYRDTFINEILFYQHPYQTLYFWLFCALTTVIGIKCLRRLKMHFSDVL